jgi:uncharacterized Zn finger protein (UPF0148 family)
VRLRFRMLEANHDGDVFCPFCEVVSLVSGAEALAEVRAASCMLTEIRLCHTSPYPEISRFQGRVD